MMTIISFCLHIIIWVTALDGHSLSGIFNRDNSKRSSIRTNAPIDPYFAEDDIKRFVIKYDEKEKQNSESFERYEGKSVRFDDFRNMLPKLNFHFDPVVNFKLKQKITKFGASITLGMDYLSDLRQWRARCDVEDTLVRGRFSLRGSELGWAKSWLWNLGLGESSSAKFKLRVGLNLKNYKAYVRLRFRTESVSPFDIGDGLTCAGKVGIPGLLHVLGSKPLRLEYLLRVRTPAPEFSIKRNDRDGLVSLSTGIDKVDISLDELNFCLEWDEESPLWDIGLVRDMNRNLRRPLNSIRGKRPTPIVSAPRAAPATSSSNYKDSYLFKTSPRSSNTNTNKETNNDITGNSSSNSNQEKASADSGSTDAGTKYQTPAPKIQVRPSNKESRYYDSFTGVRPPYS